MRLWFYFFLFFSKIFHLYSLLSFLLFYTARNFHIFFLYVFLFLIRSIGYSFNHTRISMLRPLMVEDFYAISMIFRFSLQQFSFVLKYKQNTHKKISFNFSFHFFSLVVHSKFFSFEFHSKIAVVILENVQFDQKTCDYVVCSRSRPLNNMICILFLTNCKWTTQKKISKKSL